MICGIITAYHSALRPNYSVKEENIEQKDVKIFQFGEERGIRKFKATDKVAIVVKQTSTNKEKPGSLH